MVKRLIIQHGERTTRHELTGKAIIIGRDPSCDLFFADQKLSRRHARVESDADGVKLTDLGSRNGSWVNEQRVDEHVLQPDDKVRLGRLQIVLEEDLPLTAPSPTGDDATVVLSDSARTADEGQTMRIDVTASPTRPAGETAPPGSTVVFQQAPAPDQDRTVVLSDAPQAGEDSGTVIFQPPSEGAADTTTTALRAPGSTEATIGREEQFGSESGGLGETAVGVMVEAAAETPSTRAGHRFSLPPLLIVVVLSFVAYLLVAVPLVLTTRSSLRAESLARGRALVGLLAVQNGTALAGGDLPGLSVGSVVNEPGVEDAFVLDVEGRVLAPVDRSGQFHEAVERISTEDLEEDDFYATRTDAGDYDLIRPITQRGERVGFAVLRYSGTRVAERKSVPVLLFLGFLLIAGGAWGSYFLSYRQAFAQATTETTLAEGPDPNPTE